MKTETNEYKFRDVEFSENEIVADHTEPLKKIWNLVLPKIYPHVLDLETSWAFEVEKDRYIGPYKSKERKLYYKLFVTLDNKPLLDSGWKGEKVSKELANKAYGEKYFFDLYEKLRHLAKYAGVDFSNFDMEGDVIARVEDNKPENH